ncbi:MAG: hypothetical protein GEV08_13615 [Acidimicrobiia bacterium]|nr:hypothetical protein [Acidimicrobiia bacterium]
MARDARAVEPPRPARPGRAPALLHVRLHQLRPGARGPRRGRTALADRGGRHRRALPEVPLRGRPPQRGAGHGAPRDRPPGPRRPRDDAWQQYGVRGWPTVVVVDPRGTVVGALAGEGNRPLLLQVVADTVERHDRRGSLRPVAREAAGRLALASGRVAVEGPWSFPAKVASDRSGRVVVADTGHDRVVVLELAPDAEGVVPARISHVVTGLRSPHGVRLYGSDLLICDTGNDRVVRVDLDTRPTPDEDVEPDPAGIIRLRARPVDALAVDVASPWDVVADLDRSLVVAEAGRHQLWRVPQYGASPGVIAGNRFQGLHDGRAEAAELAQPSGLARVPAGVVFVDADSSSLRILTNQGRVRTLVGEGLFDWGKRDGRGLRGRFQRPQGVAASPDGGTIYVADTYNHLIRDWYRRDLGTLPIDGLDEPRGLDVLPDGRLVIADTGNHRIVVADASTGAVLPVAVAMTTLPAAVPIVEPGTVLGVDAGGAFTLAFGVDLGPFELDGGIERPVRIVLEAEPPWLLDDGPRRWRHVAPAGALTLGAGVGGSGWLTATVTAAVRRDGACAVRTSVTRHHLTVRG